MRKHTERLGFPGKVCNPILFALAMNFFRMKVNILTVGRLQEKPTAVLFSHLSSLELHGNIQLAATYARYVSGSTVTLTVKAQLIQVNF